MCKLEIGLDASILWKNAIWDLEISQDTEVAAILVNFVLDPYFKT